MRLAAYLAETGQSVADMARGVRRPHETCRKWVTGERRPRDPRALADITAWSNGAVTANDFFAGEEDAA